jgi:glycosyltransferase involved in cell wall biosynthesis
MPNVSVIIPTYDRPHLLPRAVASARAAGADVEIIVVDDASIDETAEVCRQMPKITYVRLERNQGVAGARNIGIFTARSKYIAFLDDDDRRLPGSLDLQVEALRSNPAAGFVCGAMIMADQDFEPTGEIVCPDHSGGDVFWELLELDFPVMPLSTLICRESLLRVGLLNRHLNGIDDWDIFARLAELYPVVVGKEPVGIYRQPTPFSGQGSSARAAQLCRAVQHQPQLLSLPRAISAGPTKRRKVRRKLLKRVSETLLSMAHSQLQEREYRPAYANASTALRIDPRTLLRPSFYRRAARKFSTKRPTPPT